MGNFIAKQWAYINVDIVWVHPYLTEGLAGPNYMNPLYPPTDPLSDTDFAYLSADGDPEQTFVDAGLRL